MRTRLILAVIVAIAVAAAGCSSADEDPEDVINGYAEAFNEGDIDAVMAFFTEDSVVTRHPLARERTGLTQIRALWVQSRQGAASENATSISNVEVNGSTVTFDHVFIDDTGDNFCVEGHSAVIEDGKILSWTYADDFVDCP